MDLSDCMGLVKALVKLQLESADDSDLEELEKKFPSEWHNCWLDEQSEAVMRLLEERDVRKFCLFLSICYEKYQSDYNTRSYLMEIKYGRYVEVAFTKDGSYLLLGADGIIRSNDAAMDKRRAVSLDAREALAQPEYLES